MVLVFQEATQIDANADVTFIPFYLVSEVEPPEDLAFSEHERELLVHYTHNTGHDFREEVGCEVFLGECLKVTS